MEVQQGFSSFKEMMEAQIASHEIVAKGIIDEIKDTHLIIHDYTGSYKKYKNDLMEKYYHIITQGFEYKWFREHPIYFRFTEGGTIHEMQLRHFVTNLLFWSAIVRVDPENLDESHIIDCTQLSTKLIKRYVDDKIIPYRSEIPSDKLGSIIHDMIYDLSKISYDFNEILAISMNVEMFIDLAQRKPRFREILNTRVPEDMQPHEIEEMLNKLTKEHMDIIVNDEQYNHMKPIMKSSGAIKSGQYREFAVNRGLKPDLSGVTIPSPAQTNYLVGGLNTVSSIFIESLAGRKSLIMNKTVNHSRLVS